MGAPDTPAVKPTAAELVALSGLDALTADSAEYEWGTSLDTLAKLCAAPGVTPLDRELVRRAAERLCGERGIPHPGRLVAAAFKTTDPPSGARPDAADRQGAAPMLADPAPWSEPVDGAALLTDLVAAFTRHVVLPEDAAVAAALWVLHAHALDAFAVSPLLAITSPEKRCGKSTFLALLGALVPRPLSAASITPAALFRAIERFRPTLLVDEADTFMDGKDELRGLLNAGHLRSSAVVVRTVNDDFEPRTFTVWAAKAVARIGELPDTLHDRAVGIRLRRKTPGERVERLRLDRLSDLDPLRCRAWRWAQDALDRLRAIDPPTPAALHDRAADNWRPLLAIADLAGGAWPVRARDAAGRLSGGDTADGAAVQLLAACRAVLDGAEQLATADLLAALTAREEEPWPTWNHGKPISARQLARLLARFEIKPTQLRIAGAKTRGYDRAAFADAWRRYLPPIPPSDPVQAVQPSRGAGFLTISDPVQAPAVPDAQMPGKPHETGVVPLVPDREGEPGPERTPEGFDPEMVIPCAHGERGAREPWRTTSGLWVCSVCHPQPKAAA